MSDNGSVRTNSSYATPPQVRARRYSRLHAAARILSHKSVKENNNGKPFPVSYCLTRPVDGKNYADILRLDGKSYLSNMHLCGSVWTCPVCAARISEGRRQELKSAIDSNKYLMVLVTFTLHHSREEDTGKLSELINDLNKSYRSLKTGKPWKRIVERFSIEGYVTSTEFTWGYGSGWHPHKHVLFFLDMSESEFKPDEFKEVLSDRYKRMLSKNSRYADSVHGVNVIVGNNGAKSYIAKWGLEDELTKATSKNSKDGLNPFQLLDLFNDGKEWAGDLFAEYAIATKGKRQLDWSSGMREKLGIGAEKTDQELSEIEPIEDGKIPEHFAKIDNYAIYKFYRLQLFGELLDVCDQASELQFIAYMESKGVDRIHYRIGAQLQLEEVTECL